MKNKLKEAIEIFRLNTADHPESSNAFDSFGEAYFVLGDTESARRCYEKAVDLNPNNLNALKMLKKIGQ